MRLNITDNKDQVVPYLFEFLSGKVLNKKVKIILNGKELTGVVLDITLDLNKFSIIQLTFDSEVFEIPFDEGSKIRFDRELFFFETQSHTTLIYV